MQDIHLVNILKGLVIDAVHKANSGHPGGPMSSMDLAYLLYTETLRFDPDDPQWRGRDRFILSAGHMSMLQYTMLLGLGWLTMDDLKAFRQLHARTPGHPENFMTPGVECTTGPLGQGAAMSVGFAVAAAHLATALDPNLFNYKTWAIVSDGDLQEGVAIDAAALAGHLKLNNLVWIYDRNQVQLSGPTKDCVSHDDRKVFEGFGWKVLEIDGHDHKAIRQAYATARAEQGAPTIILANTVIGKGCFSLENSSKTHGSPLPPDERLKTKAKLGLPETEDFFFPDEAQRHFQRSFAERRTQVSEWQNHLDKRLEREPDFAKRWRVFFEAQDYSALPRRQWTERTVATRNAFGDLLQHWAAALPNLIGGSADLAPSVMTGAFAKEVGDFTAENRQGRNINFGVREFAMSALCNGIALHGGLIPFDATFLAFADYSRGALRLGALQRARVIHEFTHDSFHLGEDGPTHQPVEQVMALRLIPDLYVMRPADANETEILLRKAFALNLPSAFCLTRQKVPVMLNNYNITPDTLLNAARGAYVVRDCVGEPTMLLLATGSEVALAIAAAEHLHHAGHSQVRVISMPCWELFQEQSEAYKNAVLPPAVTRRVSLEAGITLGWERWVGMRGLTIGLDHFGASAPAEVLAIEYGFTVESVIKRIAAHSF